MGTECRYRTTQQTLTKIGIAVLKKSGISDSFILTEGLTGRWDLGSWQAWGRGNTTSWASGWEQGTADQHLIIMCWYTYNLTDMELVSFLARSTARRRWWWGARTQTGHSCPPRPAWRVVLSEESGVITGSSMCHPRTVPARRLHAVEPWAGLAAGARAHGAAGAGLPPQPRAQRLPPACQAQAGGWGGGVCEGTDGGPSVSGEYCPKIYCVLLSPGSCWTISRVTQAKISPDCANLIGYTTPSW